MGFGLFELLIIAAVLLLAVGVPIVVVLVMILSKRDK